MLDPITAYRAARCDRVMRERFGMPGCAAPEEHALRFDPERHIVGLLVLALLIGAVLGWLTADWAIVPIH